MKHLGDITKIHGDKIEPVDCITFGSPCQDLSIAGCRAGLAGERSGLFMEAVRVIKEMRSSTNGLYPTFAVWENVPGAFSSNRREDFRAVLEELARVEQPDASIPRPSGKNGKWEKAGAISGNGWSLAWRQLDAQYWGVPQRRKRIALVADFGGQRAAEILFERTSLSGNPCESIPAWKTFARTPEASVAGYDRMVESGNSITGDAESEGTGRSGGKGTGRVLESDHRETSTRCTEPAAYTLKIRSGCEGGGKGTLVQTEKSATLSTLQDQTLFQPVVYDARGNGDGKIVPTITGDHENRITDYTAIAIERKTFNEQSFSHYKESDKCSTLKAKAGNIGNGSELLIAEKAIRWIVRRLTPVECERLQGYPDGYTDIGDWTDSKGKKHKYADSPRYKALGNSIALPQWFWLVQKMRPYLKEKPTLGSLFDGLGGFPLVWQRAYGDGTARWASEIEEFPMAVTKRRFGEE
jgi:cytosine-specific methyltransferase|nr:MAG TPA: Cytosine specific methyltransferase [Caudoviricetes sp.]